MRRTVRMIESSSYYDYPRVCTQLILEIRRRGSFPKGIGMSRLVLSPISTTILILVLTIISLWPNRQLDAQTEAANSKPNQSKSNPSDKKVHIPAVLSIEDFKKIPGEIDVRLLDLGPSHEKYIAGHLPGALFVDWIKDVTSLTNRNRYNLPTAEQFAGLMQRLGIEPHFHVVIYDDLNSRIAIRTFMVMKYFGHENVHLLDGGKKQWVAKGEKLTQSIPRIRQSKYKTPKPDLSLTTSAKAIVQGLDQKSLALIDGRPPKQFSGAEPGKVFHTGKPHKKRGHIPGATNLFWKDNFNSDGTLKSKPELEKMYGKFLGNKSPEVVTYCNEGLHAAIPWFVLTEILDVDNVKVYDDSMSEWANEDYPTETR